MGMKRIYTCDICRAEKSIGQLFGLYFSNLVKFKIGSATSTDGIHICKDCMKQIKEQIEFIGI